MFVTAKGKHILLDTNVFVYALKFPNKFFPIFKAFKDQDCPLITIDAVYFELVRGARNGKEYGMYTNYFSELGVPILPIRNDDVECATNIAAICLFKNHDSGKRMSYPDCLLASQLIKYGNNIALLTTNIFDFCPEVFNRVSVQAFDFEHEVVTFGLIAANPSKFSEAKERFATVC